MTNWYILCNDANNKSNSNRNKHISKSFLEIVFDRLYAAYGCQGWWPADNSFEMAIGAILTQNVSWQNAERAIFTLKNEDLLSPYALLRTPDDILGELIRPSGYFNAKAKKIKAFACHLVNNYQGEMEIMLDQDTSTLRNELLSIHGIGPETADAIMLYAGERPVFVVDAYTTRLLTRLGIVTNYKDYSDIQTIFHTNLPQDTTLFNEFHALIDNHGKRICKKNRPSCLRCTLINLCPAGQQNKERSEVK